MTINDSQTSYVLYNYDDTVIGTYDNIEDATEVYITNKQYYGAYLTQVIRSEKIIRDRRV